MSLVTVEGQVKASGWVEGMHSLPSHKYPHKLLPSTDRFPLGSHRVPTLIPFNMIRIHFLNVLFFKGFRVYGLISEVQGERAEREREMEPTHPLNPKPRAVPTSPPCHPRMPSPALGSWVGGAGSGRGVGPPVKKVRQERVRVTCVKSCEATGKTDRLAPGSMIFATRLTLPLKLCPCLSVKSGSVS